VISETLSYLRRSQCFANSLKEILNFCFDGRMILTLGEVDSE